MLFCFLWNIILKIYTEMVVLKKKNKNGKIFVSTVLEQILLSSIELFVKTRSPVCLLGCTGYILSLQQCKFTFISYTPTVTFWLISSNVPQDLYSVMCYQCPWFLELRGFLNILLEKLKNLTCTLLPGSKPRCDKPNGPLWLGAVRNHHSIKYISNISSQWKCTKQLSGLSLLIQKRSVIPDDLQSLFKLKWYHIYILF